MKAASQQQVEQAEKLLAERNFAEAQVRATLAVAAAILEAGRVIAMARR